MKEHESHSEASARSICGYIAQHMAAAAPGAAPPIEATGPEWVMAGMDDQGASLPAAIEYMPAGVSEIRARKQGRPISARVRVDRATAERLQACLEAHLQGSKHRPFFGFDHNPDRSEASAWPTRFFWHDGAAPGVWAAVEWSEPGAKAIQGRAYRSFSPVFFIDAGDPAEVTDAGFRMGDLVNQPAFRKLEPIWAGHAAAQATGTSQHTRTQDMDETTKTELAAAQARIAALEAEGTALKAQLAEADQADAIAAKDAEIADVKRKLEAAADEARARRRRDADAVVASAITRGAIAAKDEATQKKWRDLIEADPANAELLARQPGHPALTAGRITRSEVQVVSTDTNDVLRGYIHAGTPREKGAIYARDLAPRIAKGENVMARWPVEAVNTLGTLVNALVSQRTLELVVSKRPMLRGVTLDFSDEVRSKDDTVKTRTIGLPTAQTFGGTVSAAADTDVTITLDLFKEVRYTFTAAEVVGTARNLVAERSEALAVGLGNSMVDALAALITEANFGTDNQTIKASASTDFSTLTGVNKAMNAAGVPDTYRFAWVNSDVAEALRNDELLIENFDRSAMASAYAHWQNVVGFADIWEFPALPANSCNLTGFFASRSALCIAARIPRNPAEISGASYPGTLAVVTDPVTGLSVLRNEWIEGSTWEVNTRLVTLYGVDVGQAACGHTLVSAA